MKPASDLTVDYKALVRQGYDRCAAAYAAARQKEAPPELEMVTSRLEDGASVLDIGCGPGVPVARTLAQRFQVTGVDISREMVRLARENVPQGRFVQGDIMEVEFRPEEFSAAVAFYSFFHLPREQHGELLRRVCGWLVEGGLLLATVAQQSEAGYTEDGFFGVRMYWSNYGLAEYVEMLRIIGFQVLATGRVGHGYEEGEEEVHPWVFCSKGEGGPGVRLSGDGRMVGSVAGGCKIQGCVR